MLAGCAAANMGSLLKLWRKKLFKTLGVGDEPHRNRRERDAVNLDKWGKILVAVGSLICHCGAIVFFGFAHQVGTVRAVDWIADESNFKGFRDSGVPERIAVLMPCHQYPWKAYVHRDADMSFLDCSPPLHPPLSTRQPYVDEAARFHFWPLTFLHQRYGTPG